MAILDNTAESAAVLLSFYTALLRRWTVHLMCETQPSPAQSTGPTTYLDSLSAHASLLSLTLLTSYPTTLNSITVTLAYHSALTHTISHAPTTHNIRILTPLPLSVYLLAFLAPSAAVLSTLASLLATYKLTFEASMVSPLHPPPREYPRDYVNAFNGFLMDICNLLWRSRAFNTTDTNALGCLLPAPVTASLRAYVERLSPPQVLQTLFSLSHNPALVGLSIAALRDLEDRSVETEMETRISVRHAGPVTQRSLAALAADGGIRIGWAEYRLEVLNWLGDVGVHGVGELMFCTMKHLMGQKAAGDGVARG
jgi:centromere protein I